MNGGRGRWRATLVVAVAVGVAATTAGCSGDDADPAAGGADPVAEAHRTGDLGESTEALIGADRPSAPDELAAALADDIAMTVQLAHLPPAEYEARTGTTATAAVADIGRYLGDARSALVGSRDRGAATLATQLAWQLGGRLGDPAEGDPGRLGWVVTDVADLLPDQRRALVEALDEGATDRVLDEVDGLDAATVIEQAYEELAGVVPVGNETDLLTTLRTAYTAAAAA